MELKVWVDGIQRVVCGANYNTTCQDVVFALASAMGRTGRFTLVEKWRDSERPLFPYEYPLQSLQKWGEYAGEIRFYLVQAEIDVVQQQLKVNQQQNKTQTFSNFVNKCNNPPQSLHAHLKPSEVESLKRSSTFSCAHRTNFEALPSSFSSSVQKSASEHTTSKLYNQQASAAVTTLSGHHLIGFALVPNSQATAFSSASSSDSSSRSSSTSLRYLPQSKVPSRQSSEHYSLPITRGDTRELHPVPSAKGETKLLHPFPSVRGDTRLLHPVPSARDDTRVLHPIPSARGDTRLLHPVPSARDDTRVLHPVPSARGDTRLLHPVPSVRGDVRELHPANVPENLLSYSLQTKDFPSNSSSFSQYLSSPPAMVPSQHVEPAVQHPHQRHIPKPLALTSTPDHQTSSKFLISPASLQQSFHPQDHNQFISSKQSNVQRLQSQQPFPQTDQSEKDLQSGQLQHRYPKSDISQQLLAQSDQSKLSTKSEQSQQWYPYQSDIYPHNSQSQQLNQARSAAQSQLPFSSVEYKNTPSNLKQSRERVHYRNSHSSKLVPTADVLQENSRLPLNNVRARPVQESFTDDTNHFSDSVFDDDDDDIDETHRGSHHVQSENISQKFLNNYNSSTQEKPMPKDNLETNTDNKSATLDRRNTKAKVNKELPNRSLSTGDHGDKHKKDLPSGFDVNQHTQGEGGNKLTFVGSAAMRYQKISTGDTNTKTSSFTSAVAYVRNQGDGKLSQIKTHTRQQISDSNQEHASIGHETTHGIKTSKQTAHSLEQPGSVINGHNNHQPLQISTKPPVIFNSISSSQHKSAFTEVSQKSDHPESSSSLSSVPTGFNINHMNVSSDSYQKQNSQTRIEVEEYDLDQNFPDILNGQITNVRGVDGDHRLNLFLKQHSDHGIKTSQTEGDRMQLLRTVHVQQERLKTQEAQIHDASLEIAALEQEESSNKTKLEAITTEICQLEKQEAEIKGELDNLEKTDWLTFLTGEQRKEADIKMQVRSVREKHEQIQSQIKQHSEEADLKSNELRLEEERIKEENKNNEELERKALLQIGQMTDQLPGLVKTIDEGNKKLRDIETIIQETDITLRQKEEKVKTLEKELQNENSEGGLKSSPLSNEPFNSDSFSQSPINALSISENGETILKILEGRLSPYSSSSPLGDGGDSLGGVTSVQHNYKTAMAVKNPNGVWV